MSLHIAKIFRRSAWGERGNRCCVAGVGAARQARVKKIVIDKKVSPAFDGASFGAAGQYETLAGRAFGELDPNDPHNAIITDIHLAPKNANGKVEYMATFFLVKPIDMSKSSHLMWHDVPNRGGRITIVAAERTDGDIGLSSGWQGDNSGATVPGANNDYVVVPIAKNPDGSPITGLVMGRIVNASGVDSQPMIVHSNPVPYKPVTLDTTQATLTTHASETIDGRSARRPTIREHRLGVGELQRDQSVPGHARPDADLPEERLRSRAALSGRLHGQGSVRARDRLRRVPRRRRPSSRTQTQDDDGTPNPVATGSPGSSAAAVRSRATSCAAFLHLGFNQDEAGRKVYDGAWPIIAGRRVALNFRFAMPDGVLKLYEAGSEGPQWWAPWPDPVRGLPARGILDRCTASNTCPKIIEHFGAAEVWGLKLSPEWVGTAADARHPAAGQRAPVLHPEHPARRRRRRLQRQSRRPPPVAPAPTTAGARSPPIRCRTRKRSTRCGSISATG